MSSATCDLDPIPTFIVKECLEVLLPPITKIGNLSLVLGVFPAELKSARVKPLIKKVSLDPEINKNYRPGSNLAFISKVIEKAAASQLQNYIRDNNLNESTHVNVNVNFIYL